MDEEKRTLDRNALLIKGVCEMGFNAPTKLQKIALPILLPDPPQNMIAQSQSGTGKTAAFVLAMLSRVDPSLNYPQVLCLTPSYELAIQIGNVAAKMSKECNDIRIRFAVRGEKVERTARLTEQVIVGTPGKVVDWAMKYKFFDINKIRVFVLDEADTMIGSVMSRFYAQGQHYQTFCIIRELPKECQKMFFSTTYNDSVMDFAEALIYNPVLIRLRREEEVLDNINQYYVICSNPGEQYVAISNIYRVVTIGQTIIFCCKRRTASRLAEKMTKNRHTVALLTGELPVSQRLMTLNRFREGKDRVLITTDVLARGIDFEQVTLVVNYDLPRDQNHRVDCETYLHRIGRTGRLGKVGTAVNLIHCSQAFKALRQIKEHFGKEIERLEIDCSLTSALDF